jgi:hypothetical protein
LTISFLNGVLFATMSLAAENKYVYLAYNFVIMGMFGGVLSLLPV